MAGNIVAPRPLSKMGAVSLLGMKKKLIVTPRDSGFSPELSVAGSKGKFNFNIPPKFLPGVGGGKSPLFLFVESSGGSRFLRLEQSKQGNRWELGKDASSEFKQMVVGGAPVIDQFWGEGTPISNFFKQQIGSGVPFSKVKPLLKQFNTHRQISGD